MNIPQSIQERIIHDRWKNFARVHGITLGNNKSICINNIEEAATNEDSINLALHSFVAEEIARGKNRYMYICLFHPSKKLDLQNKSHIENIISTKFNCSLGLNELLNSYAPTSNDLEKPNLVYCKASFKTLDNGIKVLDKISLCFKEFYKIEAFVHEGNRISSKIETDYIWCDIQISKQMVIVKSKDESKSTKKIRNAEGICQRYQSMIFEFFNLGEKLSVGEINNTIYKIYKEFTDTAEREFKNQVDPFKGRILSFSNEIASELNLIDATYPLNIPIRIQRLFERSLIQQNFDKYLNFFTGKKGIVTRLFFSDESGATVNARSGDKSKEGIAVADIYFDTRETIDEIKALDIIWVTWFIQNNDQLIKKSKTKIFVSTKNFVVHFLYDYVLEEEENYVFSNIEEFKNKVLPQ